MDLFVPYNDSSISNRCPRTFFRDAFRKADGTGGAYEAAEVATYTLRTHDTGQTGLSVEDNRLMATIIA